MLRTRAGLLAALVVVSALLVFGVALVAVYHFQKAQTLEARHGSWRDSASGQVMGFERQFLHFRGDLRAYLESRAPEALKDDLRLRWEVLVSRIKLMETSRDLEPLRNRGEHVELMPKLRSLVERGDMLLAREPVPRPEASEMLHVFDSLLPLVQSHTTAVAAMTSRLIEDQFNTLRHEAHAIFALAALQLILLAVTLHTLRARQRQETAARMAQDQLALELEQARVAAEAAARAKSHFLANMSHELRTPFQGVLGMMQLLEGTCLTAQQGELVRTARESANHLLAVLNGILDISAIEAGKIALHPEPLHVRRLCEDICALMRVQASEKGLGLVTSLHEPLPAWIEGDLTRIRQVLFNLLSNAIKFTPAGEVRLSVRAFGRGEGRTMLQFEVVDTGIGLDEEALARLFRRFETGDSRLSRRHGGAGLGLEISRNLARLMGGDLVGMPRHDVNGSVFIFTMVASEVAPAAPAPILPQPACGSALRVLVADDHPTNQRYLSLVLESLGHSADVCDNGEEAVELLQTDRYDAVLMDLHMPVMDGISATRAIRKLGGSFAGLPIIAMSADVMPESRERARQAGVSSFVAKPLHAADLRAALAVAAGSARSGSGRLETLIASIPPAQLSALLDSFFSDESACLRQLDDALDAGEAGAIRAAAHKLKGSAHLLGLNTVAAAAQAVENWLEDGCGQGPQALKAQLAAALEEDARVTAPLRHPAEATLATP